MDYIWLQTKMDYLEIKLNYLLMHHKKPSDF